MYLNENLNLPSFMEHNLVTKTTNASRLRNKSFEHIVQVYFVFTTKLQNRKVYVSGNKGVWEIGQHTVVTVVINIILELLLFYQDIV